MDVPYHGDWRLNNSAIFFFLKQLDRLVTYLLDFLFSDAVFDIFDQSFNHAIICCILFKVFFEAHLAISRGVLSFGF